MPPRFAPTRLVDYPWVVVRVDCVLCRRAGRYRLARLAARYGPEQSLDGLMADLARDCPWWRSNPRKYEPRCGIRFVDLESALSPPDHPDEPVHRRRAPAREDLPKLKGADRFPATYQGSGVTIGTWPDAEVVLSCEACPRREVLAKADLCGRFGADALLTNVRVLLTADCPRQRANSIYAQCGALLMRLRPLTDGR